MDRTIDTEKDMKEQTMELVERIRESELATAASKVESIARLIRETNLAIERARRDIRLHDSFVRERSKEGMTSNELLAARHQRDALVEQCNSLQRRRDELTEARRHAMESQQEAVKRFQRHQSIREQRRRVRADARQSSAQRQLDERAGYQSWLNAKESETW